MNYPLITIGMTCFNAEASIGRAIESALGQDWLNTEIVIVDDCSTDGSLAVIESFMGEHDNIRLIRHKKNCGCPVARNSVLENAKGEYIAFFDDDDWSYPSRIRRQFERIVEYGHDSEMVFCYCNWEVALVERPDDIIQLVDGIGREPLEPHGEMVAEYILLRFIVSLPGGKFPDRTWGGLGTGTMMGSRKAFKTVGLFDTVLRRHQDWDYAIRAAMLGGHFISVNETLMRQSKTTGIDKSLSTIIAVKLQFMQKYKSFFSDRGLWPYAQIMVYAGAHEFVGNKWRFKLLRSLSKRILFLSRLLGLAQQG